MLNLIKKIISSFLPQERWLFFSALVIFLLATIGRTAVAIQKNSVIIPVAGGVYTEGIIGQPIYINPIISFNQPDQDIASLLFLRLNQLIENFEIQNKGQTYIVSLKENLRWSDNQPLTSDDVIFTLQLIQNPETRSPLFSIWQGVKAERISEIKIKFSFPTPYAFFANNLARLPIIPKHIFQLIPPPNLKLSEYNLKPVSSGPYKFESFSKKNNGFIEEYRLTTNEYYQGKKPFIKKIIFKFFENENDLLEAFRLKKIDGFGSLKPLALKGFISKKTVVENIKMPRYYALFFNPNLNPLLGNKNLRYALNEALDKEKLINDVFENEVIKAQLEEPISSYNLQAAQEKLKKIKSNNLQLNLILPNTDFLKKTGAFIQKSWQNLGIKVNLIELNPEEIINEIIKSRNYEILLFGQIMDNPEDFFPFWHSSQRFNPGLNLALYENKTVDKLTEEIRQELNADHRLAKISLVKKAIADDLPAIFLYTLPYIYVHNQNLRGFSKDLIINPADRFNHISDWYVLSARVIK